MTITDKLALMKDIDKRNAENIQNSILRMQVLSKDIRVIITYSGNAFWIKAQQYAPDCNRYWEVESDGWRSTTVQRSNSFEGAKRVFDDMVRSEEHYLEMRRK